MENLWDVFTSTGSVEAYLRYKEDNGINAEESENADYNKGVSDTRG